MTSGGARVHLDMAGFDHGVQGKGGSCFALAPVTMTAMDEHWRGGHGIANLLATAATFLSPLYLLTHLMPLPIIYVVFVSLCRNMLELRLRFPLHRPCDLELA